MKFTIGLIVSFAVGVGCRYFNVPVGSPAALPGALIVLAMTAGYSWTNQLLNARNRSAANAHLCGGPTGRSVAEQQVGSPTVVLSEESVSALTVGRVGSGSEIPKPSLLAMDHSVAKRRQTTGMDGTLIPISTARLNMKQSTLRARRGNGAPAGKLHQR